MNLNRLVLQIAAVTLLSGSVYAERFDYRLLATSKTSTMEKEMNNAAEEGFVFGGVMGGETSVGGKEVVVVMMKNQDTPGDKKKYFLLATSKTGTMQKELQQAGDEGFQYCGQTVFQSAFGGREVSVILERNLTNPSTKRIEFKLLATSKTSTMEKEMREAGEAGFHFLGVLVGKTAVGGKEIVSILQRFER